MDLNYVSLVRQGLMWKGLQYLLSKLISAVLYVTGLVTAAMNNNLSIVSQWTVAIAPYP